MRRVLTAVIAATTTVSVFGGDWTWPVDDPAPEVVRAFDPPAEPWSAGHRGVDLASSPGAVVRAAGPGTVSHAGLIAGVGVVTVSHGALRTTYQPVAPDVSVGRPVQTGDVIGTLTSAGSHCRPDACLHWGLIRGSAYQDPLRLASVAGPPKLLPLDEDALRPPPRAALLPDTVSDDSSDDLSGDLSGDVGTDVGALAAAGALAGLRSVAP